MFVDASALVAIIVREPDADELSERLYASSRRLTSAIALWETAVAVARRRRTSLDTSRRDVHALVQATGLHLVAIGGPELEAALIAHARFGKGRHPARLNMGDCFAYACAQTQGVPLLYKGEDFALTDIAAA